MLPKNSSEIITEFIEQAGFSTGFAEINFPIFFPEYDLRLSASEGIDYLLGAATSGNKSIGFFHSPVYFNLHNFIKSECIFITTSLPENLCVPVIFCKNIVSFKNKLTTAIRVSEESGLPVILAISKSVLFNYCEIDDFEFDSERMAAAIDKKCLSRKISTDNFLDNLNIAEALLSASFDNKFSSGDTISLNDDQGTFFDYIVPHIKSPQLESLEKCSEIFISENEERFFKKLCLHFYPLTINYRTLPEKCEEELAPILCPGCPFAFIFSRLKTEDYLVLTDIQCPSLSRYLSVEIREADFAIGLARNNNSKMLFIGNISNFKYPLFNIKNNIEIILLKDTDTAVEIYPEIKLHKFQKTGVTLPYSCNNIRKYGKMTINLKKCKCLKKNEPPECIEQSFCPALFRNDDIILINDDLCTGCGLCKNVCPYGAVK
ncbi:4Fe-4S binding protein [Flexistipes sinusarabici]|uniref:4Fe-4S binding protein n=1 Tax=Flexistipes sinusarabici TaxID=2352 RepID=UPI0023536CED|nr:4Fe-4S binding protein [Flexistipes sinusarabici]